MGNLLTCLLELLIPVLAYFALDVVLNAVKLAVLLGIFIHVLESIVNVFQLVD